MTHIRIGNHIFIPLEENEWAMLIEDGRVALLEKRRLAPVGRTGGYGMTILTGAAESHTNLENVMGSSEFLGFRTSSNAGLTHSIDDWIQIGVNADNPLVVRLPTEVDFRIETTYYVMKDYKTYFAATARNFLALDPQIKPQIQEYLRRRERFSFSDVRDLTGLVVHCNNLLAAAHGSSTPVSTEQVRYVRPSVRRHRPALEVGGIFNPNGGFGFSTSIVPLAWQITPNIWFGVGLYFHSISGEITPKTYPSLTSLGLKEIEPGVFVLIGIEEIEIRNVVYQYGDIYSSRSNDIGPLLGMRYSFSRIQIFNNAVPFIAAAGSLPFGIRSTSSSVGQFRGGLTFYGLSKNTKLSVFTGLTRATRSFSIDTMEATYQVTYDGGINWSEESAFFGSKFWRMSTYLYFNFGVSIEF